MTKTNDNKHIGNAPQGRRILNDNIRVDYARLLEMLADGREADGEEVEELANKYRYYFDENGNLHEIQTEGGR